MVIKNPKRSKLVKLSFKKSQAIKAEVGGIKKKIETVLLAEFFFIKNISIVNAPNETKKILDQNIELSATCVRIPVLVSHAESVNIQFKKPFALEKVNEALSKADGCEVYDSRKDGGYSTPIEAAGKNETFISRIREDKTNKNTINLWIVSDNLLRGAALNSVEIAETLIKNNFYGK